MSDHRRFPYWTQAEDDLLTSLRHDHAQFDYIAERVSALGTKRSAKAASNRWRQIRPNKPAKRAAAAARDPLMDLALYRPWR